MKVNESRPGRADGSAATYRRAAGLAVLVAAAAIGLAACGGSSSPHVASLTSAGGNGSGNAVAVLSAKSSGNDGRNAATTASKGNPTALLDEWATCMHSHGDPNQADPTVDAHGVINISIAADAQDLSGAVHGGTDPCNRFVAAAQSALRAANPVSAPPNQAEGLKYVNCMRANGVPNYPYPTGNTTNFNGTGVDPTSPFVQNVNQVCGKKLGLPAWWINGTGPPGDVVVSSGRPGGGPPPRGGPRPAGPGGDGGTGGNSGSGTGA
jgi:hypothetical protein